MDIGLLLTPRSKLENSSERRKHHKDKVRLFVEYNSNTDFLHPLMMLKRRKHASDVDYGYRKF